jgi:hypothetical protein
VTKFFHPIISETREAPRNGRHQSVEQAGTPGKAASVGAEFGMPDARIEDFFFCFGRFLVYRLANEYSGTAQGH